MRCAHPNLCTLLGPVPLDRRPREHVGEGDGMLASCKSGLFVNREKIQFSTCVD